MQSDRCGETELGGTKGNTLDSVSPQGAKMCSGVSVR